MAQNGTVSNGRKRALVVVAHPDDPEFLFGAAVAKLVADGTEVTYVICSDGANGSRDPATPPDEVAAIRCAEQNAAAQVLGVSEVVFLGFPDGRLEASHELRLAIARAIRRFRPELVIAHYPHRVLDIPIEASHPDHLAAGEATLAAIFPDAGNARAFPELQREGLAPFRVKEIWLAGNEGANHGVDATPYVERKIQAICCHKSQVGATAPPWVYEWMKRSGARIGYEYGEEYKRIQL